MSIKTWFTGKNKGDPERPDAPAIEPPAAAPATAAASQAAPAAKPTQPPPIDFVAILETAGVHQDVRERVLKGKQLLRSMPSGTPAETKRQIVEAAFQAFEIPTRKIVEGAAAEIEALRAYIQAGEDEKKSKLAEGERRIAELDKQIQETRALMDAAVAAQERRHRLTSDEIATVQPIVDFFAQQAKAAPPAKSPAAGAQKPAAEPDPDVDVDDDFPGAMVAKPPEAKPPKPAPEPKVVVSKTS